MPHNLFLIFNHRFTREQEADAAATLGVKRIIEPPADLQDLWGDIPPDLPAIEDYLGPLRQWLVSLAAPGDYVLIQGDFGACFLMASFAFTHGLTPVYSTTRREAVEQVEPDGAVRLTHLFRHRTFRRYGE
ncbi:MAG: CRISPR-associated protein Csx20 [Deltaproteobacteria bacterium]|jgi:hypothetical protein|nr:CRISPR-associated protein Csx20 [Deltaproteobacteria bacterium]